LKFVGNFRQDSVR